MCYHSGQLVAQNDAMNEIRDIRAEDISSVKAIADANRVALGFNTRKRFEEIVQQERGFVAIADNRVIGFLIFRHRKADLQTTLSDICVHQEYRDRHIGKQLITTLLQECMKKSRSFIQLKCPANLAANEFYRKLGFELHAIEAGKKLNLNVGRQTSQIDECKEE